MLRPKNTFDPWSFSPGGGDSCANSLAVDTDGFPFLPSPPRPRNGIFSPPLFVGSGLRGPDYAERFRDGFATRSGGFDSLEVGLERPLPCGAFGATRAVSKEVRVRLQHL